MNPFGEWIETEKYLPSQDGFYEVCNVPELNYDSSKITLRVVGEYDGYGFKVCGIYRPVQYWRVYIAPEKKYGKVNQK